MKTISPFGDRIVVLRDVASAVRDSGFIKVQLTTETLDTGKVIAVGPGKNVNGVLQPMYANIGDTVAFPKNAGVDLVLDDIKYLVLDQDSLIGILN